MITRTAASWQTKDWQFALSASIKTLAELWEVLGLTADTLPETLQAQADFPVRIPQAYLAKIRREDPHDPLLLQVLPRPEEAEPSPGYVTDPLAEHQSNPQPGVLHKYQSRLLLTLTGVCAVNCRYCFRRHFPYQDNGVQSAELPRIIEYLEAHPEVNEVILSGGDPLVASNTQLARVLALLQAVPQVKRLRIHSRFPVVIPQRIDDELLQILDNSHCQIVMVLHSNHAQELDAEFDRAMKPLQAIGVTLLNQAVLLRGVNDNAEALVNLSERLFQAGVLPYYLHLLDPVAGAHHFNVPEREAKLLMRQVQNRLPGYLVPRLVREEAGRLSKTLISWEFE